MIDAAQRTSHRNRVKTIDLLQSLSHFGQIVFSLFTGQIETGIWIGVAADIEAGSGADRRPEGEPLIRIVESLSNERINNDSIRLYRKPIGKRQAHFSALSDMNPK